MQHPIDICASNKAVSLEVKNFMIKVPDVKEESITDYLVWKWREVDKRFQYLSVTTFNRQEESSTTGADFALELWIVGDWGHVSLAVQAKKFIKLHDSYIKKLKYPHDTKKQLDTLLTYATKHNKLPFYFIYSIANNQTSTRCNLHNTADSAIFMVHAKVIEEFADGKKGKHASRDELIGASHPFHCMFCCPLAKHGFYFHEYFSHYIAGASPRKNDELPKYVKDLLNTCHDQTSNESLRAIAADDRKDWAAFRTVGVYDMRHKECL